MRRETGDWGPDWPPLPGVSLSGREVPGRGLPPPSKGAGIPARALLLAFPGGG